MLAGVARLVSFLFFGEKKNVCYAHTTRSEVLRAHTHKKKRVLSLSLFREHARDDFTTVKPREKDPTTGVLVAVVKAPPFKQEEEEEFDEKRRMMISFVNEKKRTLTDFEKKKKKEEKKDTHAHTHTQKKKKKRNVACFCCCCQSRWIFFERAKECVVGKLYNCSSAASLRGRGDRSKKKGRRRRRRRDKEVNF